ncbi:Uncharacterised protein [Vibrio cholerae]|nr:Uncharacterised protein [Vibrio cholerae]
MQLDIVNFNDDAINLISQRLATLQNVLIKSFDFGERSYQFGFWTNRQPPAL